MAANNALKITDINFDAIKSNLRDFLSSQTELQDYDYDSSTIQTLLNILAYNTYYNSFYTNMIANESFLDSALIRNNVVSRAKMLNYVPSSARGATAQLRVTLNPTGSPESLIIETGTQFTTNIDEVAYTFSTPSATGVSPNANGDYIATISIKEGDPVQESYTVNSNAPERYFLNNVNADTSSLIVSVQESSSNTTTTNYSLVSDISTVNSISTVYYIQEADDQKYEVFFGDNILGKSPRDGNIVRLNYNVTNGPLVNNANTFTAVSTIAGLSDFSFTVTSRATGGSSQESIDSIKFNAPRAYSSQNRAVTAEDYKNILLSEAPDLQTVSVWGGEENSPPQYGVVYISAKPADDNILTDLRKEQLTALLENRNVLTIKPEFVDAQFLYIVPRVEATYDPDRTTLSAGTILNKINTTIDNFQAQNLNSFGSIFYYSNLIRRVDDSDLSIEGTQLSITMQKRFVPITTEATSYFLNFNNPIFNPHPGHKFAISSTEFTFDGNQCFFDDDGNGNIRIFRLVLGSRVFLNTTAGTVDYNTGTVVIDSVIITDFVGDSIKVNAVPAQQNINSSRNLLLLLADSTIEVINENTGTIESRVTNTTSTQGTTDLSSSSSIVSSSTGSSTVTYFY